MNLKIVCLFFILPLTIPGLNVFSQNLSMGPAIKQAKPFSNASVVLTDSWVKHREDLNTTYLKSLDPDRLLHNFRVNAGLPSETEPLEGWEAPNIGLRGHFTGHYLSAVSVLVEKYNDPVLRQRLNYMVDELFICQQSLGDKGYLSAFPERDFDRLETRFGGVWAPYYTYQKIMQGLLDAYTHAGIKKAYDMVINMAAYVDMRMSKLDNETIEKILYTAAANPGNEAGAMNEVLYNLYKISKNPKHLTLAKLFDRDWFAVPLSENEDILSGLHANTHIVLVNGFAQRYSITGEERYHDAVVNFWDMLIHHHAYANGSSSGPRPNAITPTSQKAEHWGVASQLSNTMSKEIAESCVSHNTQKLSSTLFSWTANPIYADAYMNTFLNSIMALQSAHSGKCVYHLPLGSPRKKTYLNENDFRCCNGSSVEAFALLNSGIYYHNDESLWVNLYIPSKVLWNEKDVELEQTGNFPVSPVVEFTLSAKRKSSFDVNLLIPSWAGKVEVYINGEKQNVEPKANSFISLNREWMDMDKIKLVFQYDFYVKPMPDDKNVIAIFYGPTLLAFENDSELILKGNAETIVNNLSVQEDSYLFMLNNNGKEFKLRPFYEIENESYGVYATIRNY